jgi:hypothetical protein
MRYLQIHPVFNEICDVYQGADVCVSREETVAQPSSSVRPIRVCSGVKSRLGVDDEPGFDEEGEGGASE